MNFDEVYKYVGHMGRFQWLIYAVMFLLNLFCIDFLNMIFVGGQMDHWCSVDELSGLTPEQQRYVAIPMTSSSSDDVVVYSSCEMFEVNWTAFSVDELLSWNRTERMVEMSQSNSSVSVRKCSSLNYDRSTFTSTIVSRYDLVCGREYFIEMSITLMMVGILVGTVTTGYLSDRFGRKNALIIALMVRTVGSVIAIFSNSFEVFVAGRIIAGFGTAGCYLISFVLVLELSGPKCRTLVGAGMQLSWSLGFVLIVIFAYFLRDDFTLMIVTVGPAVLFLPFVIWMPESPRWLIVQNRHAQARKVLQRICKGNGTRFPDDIDLSTIDAQDTAVENKGCSALLRSPTMRLRTVVMLFSWFTCALVYCALSMFSTHQNVSTSIYVSTLINALIEIPVNGGAIWIIAWKPLGRKRTGIISLIGAGVTSFVGALSIWNENHVIAMIMSLLGKAFITLAFSVVYVYGSEIFPTEVRNVGVGTASMFQSFGAIVAPIIGGLLKRTWLPLPSIIYGVTATISGLSYLYLPETLGRPLPDTIEQADKMAAEQKQRIKTKNKKRTMTNPVQPASEDTKEEDTRDILKDKEPNGEEVFNYTDLDKEKQILRQNASRESFEIANMIRDTVI